MKWGGWFVMKERKTAVIATRAYTNPETRPPRFIFPVLSSSATPLFFLSSPLLAESKPENTLTPLGPPLSYSILQPHPGGLLLCVAALSKVRTGDLSPSLLSTVSHSQFQQSLGGDDSAACFFFQTHTQTHRFSESGSTAQ